MADDFGLRSIFAELAPTPRRWLRAARVASITALGAGVMATMQIANPLGLTMLINLALPEFAFPLSRGVAFLCCAATFQILTVVVAVALANSPVLNLAAFVLLSLATSYLIYAIPTLGRLWLWIQVPVVTGFYMVLFAPNQLGWDNAQMFAGITIAVALLLLFNNLLWPESPEVTLGESLLETLERSRYRLMRLMAIATGDASPDKVRPVASQLGHHVILLSQAAHKFSRPEELTRLLAAVMFAERLHNQIERVASLIAEAHGANLDAQSASELRDLTDKIDSAFQRRILELRQKVEGVATPDAPIVLGSRSLSIRPPEIARESLESPLASALGALDELLETDLFELFSDHYESDEAAPPSATGSSPFLVRFTVRHTLAMATAFLLGLWDNNSALHAAIWLLMLGGPPSHGATVRKFTLRALGSSGALTLAALGTIIVAPNYTSLVPYMAVIFTGALFMTYIGEGGGILSYLAIGGTAFVIAYSGPGPRSDVLDSIWSVWGISVGMMIRALATLLWRERSHRTLAEEFQAPVKTLLDLTQRPEGTAGLRGIYAAEVKIARSIQTMLGVANDGQLEGRRAGIDPSNLVDALDTMLRLTFVLAYADRLTASGTEAISESVVRDVRVRFESWLESLISQTESGHISPAPLRRMVSEATLPPFAELEQNRAGAMYAGTELDRWIIALTRTLERQLATVSLS